MSGTELSDRFRDATPCAIQLDHAPSCTRDAPRKTWLVAVSSSVHECSFVLIDLIVGKAADHLSGAAVRASNPKKSETL